LSSFPQSCLDETTRKMRRGKDAHWSRSTTRPVVLSLPALKKPGLLWKAAVSSEDDSNRGMINFLISRRCFTLSCLDETRKRSWNGHPLIALWCLETKNKSNQWTIKQNTCRVVPHACIWFVWMSSIDDNRSGKKTKKLP
jgi:hypothetical protein